MASDKCIINIAIDYWYPKGQKRLIKSLKENNFDGDILTWTKFANKNYDESSPYNCKASAIEEAMEKGYKQIFWMDCSVWAIKDVQPLFDIIKNDGYYFIDNGYNCAQTCSDNCLDIFTINRNEAEKMTEVATTIFGLNLSNEHGMNFANAFIKATKDGAAMGSRDHNNQSQDTRFKFHRQDQSVASIIYGKMKLDKIHKWGDHLEYNPEQIKPHTLLTLQGMIH